ncbi:MFS transporter [Emcibacter sp. SYSU 3D8]|uniref:MFS transporter n=1 Tax=Emcibacter sp. SYSU 3D8 TaxID=3133969 RepID=UPI0031FE5AC2
MVEETGHRPLSRRTIVFYGLSEMPLQVASVVVSAYLLNYYATDLGLGLAAMGFVWLLARIFDGVTDPLIGYLSDITRTRWGRRRIWMVASVPVMMLAVWKLFFPQLPVDETYFLIWMLMLWLGWTMLLIPYYAWAAELSTDYNERSVIVGWRVWLGMAANVSSKALPVLALLVFGFGGTREVLLMVGAMTLVLVPLTVGLTVANVPELPEFQPTTIPFWRGLKVMWRNGPFRRLIVAFFISYMGTTVATATVLFYIRSVVGEEKLGIVFLLAFYLACLVGIPFWVWLSKRIGKHKTWIACLMIYPCTSPFYLLLGEGDFWWMIPITMATGFGAGSNQVLASSMKADVIDLDTMMTGQNRAALFFSVWAMATKLALSIGPWLALTLLAWLAFDPAPGAANSDTSLWGLKLVFALGPPVFMIVTIIVAWRYPITEERHRRMRAAIERRNARRTERERVAEAVRATAEWATYSPAPVPLRPGPDPARG